MPHFDGTSEEEKIARYLFSVVLFEKSCFKAGDIILERWPRYICGFIQISWHCWVSIIIFSVKRDSSDRRTNKYHEKGALLGKDWGEAGIILHMRMVCAFKEIFWQKLFWKNNRPVL
jgi:hypothetical protein